VQREGKLEALVMSYGYHGTVIGISDLTQSPDMGGIAEQKIAEYFGVSEEKLNALPPAKFIELRDNGALGQIYAHMHSLVGWDRLIALAMTRESEQQQQTPTLNS